MSQSAALNASASRMSSTDIQIRLSIMMFLEFFIWGAWYVTIFPFMSAHGMLNDGGLPYVLNPVAAIISPFFLGMIADRFFPSQRVLGVMHLIGAAALFAIPAVVPAFVPNPAKPEGPPILAPGASSFAFLALVFVHSLCYMPTINLTNSVAFANLTNQEKQFPYIRVFGTFGWIAAGLLISLLKADKTQGQFYIAATAAAVMAIYSFFLPHTPPPAKGKRVSVREVLGLDALALFKSRSFAVFAISSFLICIPLSAYYGKAAGTVEAALLAQDSSASTTPDKAISPPTTTTTTTSAPVPKAPPVAAWMTVGQGAEVIFMLIMPFFFRKLGVKWMLAAGMLAWVARYALFAAGITGPIFSLIILGVALHGICYDFFFVTGFIYTDKRAAKQITGQAQGLIVLLTYGVGLAIGGWVSAELYKHIVADKIGPDALRALQKFWLYPAAFAAVVFVIFTALFRDDTNESPIGPKSIATDEPEGTPTIADI